MQPTYCLSEIKSLVRSLDFNSINILVELIEEEKECYSFYELKAITKFIEIKSKAFASNEVSLEFLLSFN